MTKTQIKQLKEMSRHKFGYYPIDSNFKSKHRACEALIKDGFARHYVHGGYEITNTGREALETLAEKHE